MRRLVLSCVVAAGLASAVGCRDVALGLGETPERARRHTNELLTALARRFGPAEHDPALETLRPRLERAALVPSRVFDDPAVWPVRDGSRRSVGFDGGSETGRYRLALRATPRDLERPGDYRGRLELEQLGRGEYVWRIREELAAGTFSSLDLARAATALLRSAQDAPPDARGLVRDSLPRSTTALGRLVSLDSLELAATETGARRVTLEASLHPEWAAHGRFSRYAAFLARHALPVVFSLAVEDEAGVRYWDFDFREGRLRLRLAVHDGRLVPLDGPLRRIPDSLRAHVELTTKTGLFRSGFRDLLAEVSLLRDGTSPGFVARFPHEPDWRLPFLVEPLLRGSLRRPFDGEGALLGYSLETAGGGTTRFERRYEVAVRESWILRWFGGVVGDAVSDFRRSAEAEADLFSWQALEALRQDLGALIGG